MAEDNPWQIDSARYKFAPYLITHCRRTETIEASATTTPSLQTIIFTGFSSSAFGAFSLSATADQYWANVILLMDFDYAQGSTVWINEKSISYSFASSGQVVHDTQFPKFGTGAAVFDGSGDRLSVSNNAIWDMSATDFTIEMHFRPKAFSGLADVLMVKRVDINAGSPFLLWVNASKHLVFQAATTSAVYSITISSSFTLSTSAYYHIACQRTNSVFQLYLDGTKLGESTLSATVLANASPVYIGGDLSAYSVNGYIDNIRVTKGIARYSGNFTPPTSAYIEG